MWDLVSGGNLRFAVHGGADAGGGAAGAVDGILSFIESLLSLSGAELFARLMPGLAALENWHPLFVHFPIALLSLFFLFDMLGNWAGKTAWRQVAAWFLYAGAPLAGLTVVMGLLAAASVAHGDDVHELMEHHEHLGISVFVLASVLALWRWLAKQGLQGPANTLYGLLSAILFGLLAFTADLGGLMVYRYGVAVEPVARSNQAAAARHQHGDNRQEDDVDERNAQPSESDEHHELHDHHEHAHAH